MPQVDKATFYPIVFWTFMLYVGGFLFLNSASLFSFIVTMKLVQKRRTYVYLSAVSNRRLISNILLFPWISL